jgi:uncharacterized protein YbcI
MIDRVRAMKAVWAPQREAIKAKASIDVAVARERLAKTRSMVSDEVAGEPLKTRGQIEAAVCEGTRRIEREYIGGCPQDIHAYLIDFFLVVRLEGALTAIEQQLTKSFPPDKGRSLVKQVRTHLIETARPLLDVMVHEATGVKAVSLHYDISTVTGEEVLVFSLADLPVVRATRMR